MTEVKPLLTRLRHFASGHSLSPKALTLRQLLIDAGLDVVGSAAEVLLLHNIIPTFPHLSSEQKSQLLHLLKNSEFHPSKFLHH